MRHFVKAIPRSLQLDRPGPAFALRNSHLTDISASGGSRPNPKLLLIQKVRRLGMESAFRRGSIFFVQGQDAAGVFLILQGAVKLSIASPGGRALNLGFPGPGSILGLGETILGRTYEGTAQAVEAGTAVFLPRLPFLKVVQQTTKTAFEAAQLLAEGYFNLLDELRTIGLSETAQQRLAAFLLGLRAGDTDDEVHIQLQGANQEDFAQMVGITRETASRLLSRLRKSQVLDWKRSTLVIRNWSALERLAEPSEQAEGWR